MSLLEATNSGWSMSDEAMVGRDNELRGLTTIIDGAGLGGTAVLVVGEPGTGKSLMLNHLAEHAARRGLTVLRAQGFDSESSLPFAALTDVVHPLRDFRNQLPATQRVAMDVVLAEALGPGPGPLATCAGALALVAAAAARHPVLVLVDDFQWVDTESAQVISFMARRLAEERIVVVLAIRDEPGRKLPELSSTVVPLTGLSRDGCAQLAANLGRRLNPDQLSRLAEWTGGNPLAVVEHLRAGPARVEPGWSTGRAGSGGGLPASLERTWGDMWNGLSDETRTAMFLVVADEGVGGVHVVAALTRLGLTLDTLRPAEDLGLVDTEHGRFRMRHPLLRSVIRSRTAVASRVAAYRALAEAADGSQRCWYLAEAALGPDESVATALVSSADDARRRGGFAMSARSLKRAADLTADTELRATRLLSAAFDAFHAGDPASSLLWSEEAARDALSPQLEIAAARTVCRIRGLVGNARPAIDAAYRAVERIRSEDPLLAAQALAEATAPAAMTGDITLTRRIAVDVERIWEESGSTGPLDSTTQTLVVAREAVTISGIRSRRRVRRNCRWPGRQERA